MVWLHEIFEALAAHIAEENAALRQQGLAPLRHTEIRVMGQMSLLSNPQVVAQMQLFGTADVDATVTESIGSSKGSPSFCKPAASSSILWRMKSGFPRRRRSPKSLRTTD